MSAEPINAWDARVLVASEATFGTIPNPTAAQALEFISISTGNAELGATRPKKDRNLGRGMSDGFIVGRVAAMPWSIETSIKSRSAIDAIPNEASLLRAAGLVETVNGSSNVTYSLDSNPLTDDADTGSANALQTASIYRVLGSHGAGGDSRYYAEQMRGCVAKTLEFSGGDKELTLKAAGDGIGKYHLGYSSSITLADGAGTTLTFASQEEADRFGLGWYQCESEIIRITAISGTTGTIARAQLSSTGAAHAAKPLTPYVPSGIAYAGSPMSEVNCTISIDSQTIRFQNFTLSFTSGIELGPGETGSKYIQTPIVKRYSVKLTMKGLMRREDVALIGKCEAQVTPIAVTIQCGSVANSRVLFTLPYCEIDPFPVPDAANDVAYMTVPFRTRDSTAGNDLMTVQYF